MRFRGSLPRFVTGLLALTGTSLLAQTSSSGTATPPPSAAARAAAAATSTAASRNAARQAALAAKEIPDPNLFDGSDQPPEARPDKGMLAEFELPGSTDRPETMEQRQGQGDQQGGGGDGGGPEGEQQGAGGGAKPEGAGDPTAKAEGIAVAELQVDENSAPQQAAPPPKPRDVSMGDRSMQIPAVAQQSVVGTQQPGAGQQGASNSQQYEKGAAAGKSSGNNQNKGLEKGRVIPQGL